MNKKILAIILTLSILITNSMINVFASNDNLVFEETSTALVLLDKMNTNIDNCDFKDVYSFKKSDLNQLLEYNLILTDNDFLSKIDGNKIVELIDNGATLLIQDKNISLKEVSGFLELNEPDDRFVRGAQVTGGFIFNQNNEYCYGIIGTVNCCEESSEALLDDDFYAPIPIYQNIDKLEYNDQKIGNDDIDVEKFCASIDEFRDEYNHQSVKNVKEDVVYMQLPDKAFNKVYYNFFNLDDYNGIGTASISQYVYNICTYKEGKIKKAIADVVSKFAISPPNEKMYVNNYRTRIHAKISNMDVIDQSYLQSNSSTTYTLSGGISTNGEVLSGNIGASTSNSYSTNNQTITNVFSKRKCKDWKAVPTKKWKGASWDLEPCIRIINKNATSYKSKAYSSFRNEGWIGLENIFGMNIPFVEVGGAWRV